MRTIIVEQRRLTGTSEKSFILAFPRRARGPKSFQRATFLRVVGAVASDDVRAATGGRKRDEPNAKSRTPNISSFFPAAGNVGE
jgi:hypothetical protein